MAERRMFSKRIISSDAFMDMCASAQMLYFHLSMWADDEGFVNNPKTIQRMCGATSEDMSVLTDSGLVIRFESGIVAITHWKTHNYIRGDRIKPTYCADEKAQLIVGEDGVYALAQQDSTNGGAPVADDNSEQYSDYGAEYSANSGTVADNSAQAVDSTLNGCGIGAESFAQAKDSTINGSGIGADNSAQAMDSAGNGNGAGAECYAQAEDSAQNGNGERADNSAQAKDSTLNGSGTDAESCAQAEDSSRNGSGTGAESYAQAVDSTLNANGVGADNSAQAKDSTLNGSGAGAESYAQAKDSTRNGNNSTQADNSTQNGSGTEAESSTLNGNGAGADNSAQAKDSTLNSYGTGAESYAQAMDSAINGNNSTQADNSTRKSESCDRATLIERYGIDNVIDYEDRFRKWAEKRGRQGMPLYPTISAWMKQDNVVNRREYSSIPDYYLSDDFLLEGY